MQEYVGGGGGGGGGVIGYAHLTFKYKEHICRYTNLTGS